MAGFLFRKFIKQIRRNVITGFLVIIPIAVSLFILVKLFIWIDSALPAAFGMEWPHGIGVLVILIGAYFMGLAAKNYIGKRIIGLGNAIIAKIPVLNKLYLAIQQIIDIVTLQNKKAFDHVVLVEFPRHGVYSIGFVTSESNVEFSEKVGERVVSVFVPKVPNPTTGFLLYLPEHQLINLNIPVETAIKLVMSGGMLSIDNIKSTRAMPSSLRSFNWMGLFKKDPARKGMFDPRD